MRKLFIFVIVFFSFFNKSFASGLAGLSSWNGLEITCNIEGFTREFKIYLSEIISLNDLSGKSKYEVVKQEIDIIVGTRIKNKYTKDYIIIDKKTSSVTIGEYKKNLKNENEVSTSSEGFCNRKLD